MNSVIYLLTSPSGKHYVGQTVDYERRMIEHKCKSCKSMTKLYNAIQKYGFDSFTKCIIEHVSPERLNEREIHWINHYDSFHDGYNCTSGGDGNFKRSDATRKKLSDHFRGKYYGSQNIPFTIDGIRYESVGKASLNTGIPPKTIHNRLNSSNPKFSLYIYEDTDLRSGTKPIKTTGYSCIINGRKYSSIKKASQDLRVNYHSL